VAVTVTSIFNHHRDSFTTISVQHASHYGRESNREVHSVRLESGIDSGEDASIIAAGLFGGFFSSVVMNVQAHYSGMHILVLR